MEAKLFTTAEMERDWAINDVVEAYKEELTWEAKNGKTCKLFNLTDPSRIHIKNRHLRDFNEWYPVSPHDTLIAS